MQFSPFNQNNLSEANLVLATLNYAVAAGVAINGGFNAAGAASTSLGTGFYGDVRMDMSGTKSIPKHKSILLINPN